MAPDQIRRDAARVATLVAIPVALVVGLVSLWVAGVFRGPSADVPSAAAVSVAPTDPVQMAPVSLDPDQAAVCRSLVAALPNEVGGLARRPVTGDEAALHNAAYGAPPVTLSCGVPAVSVEPTATVYPLNGVCWYAEAGTDASTWTTVDRSVPVRVRVPGPVEGSAQRVIGFSATVATYSPVRSGAPTGCQ